MLAWMANKSFKITTIYFLKSKSNTLWNCFIEIISTPLMLIHASRTPLTCWTSSYNSFLTITTMTLGTFTVNILESMGYLQWMFTQTYRPCTLWIKNVVAYHACLFILNAESVVLFLLSCWVAAISTNLNIRYYFFVMVHIHWWSNQIYCFPSGLQNVLLVKLCGIGRFLFHLWRKEKRGL